MDQLPKSNRGWILKLLWTIIGIGVIIAGIVGVMIITIYPKLPSMDELRNYQPKLPLQVYSADGVLLGQFGQEHRIFVSFPNTPKLLINAILSAEDERFYEHGGIDVLGVIRAALGNIVSGHLQSGASTITMQVARNFFLTTQKTFSRKFNEVLLSYKMEQSLSKDQILSLYINQIYLGQRAYGFAEAAETYFGKPLDKLTIAEYAVLAGLPKAPSAYNPVVNPKRSHEREMYVLGRMLKHGYITQEQYDVAIAQPIITVKGSVKDATDTGSYIAEMARQYLYPTYGDAVYTQGFKVYTTINSKYQQAAYIALRKGIINFDMTRGYQGVEQQLSLTDSSGDNSTPDQVALGLFDGVADYGDLLGAIVLNASDSEVDVILRNGNHLQFTGHQLDFVRKYIDGGGNKQIKPGAVVRVYYNVNQWQLSQIPQLQGALVSINPTTGAILAIQGGFDFSLSSFNHVMQASRQPGSSFKPFIYSSALDKGFTPETLVNDSAACFPGGNNGSQWCPKDDDNQFLGQISLRQALTFSRNLATVNLLNDITPPYAINYFTKFGFAESQFQPYLTLALGAVEQTPIQMAQAYAVFANGGYLVQPYFIDKITDTNGKVLAQTQPNNIAQQQPAIDPRNAFIMNSILKDVAKYGTGAKAYQALHRNDIAGKTGTTNDAKDLWFDGYTPDVVTISWVGYDQPKSLGRQFGSTLALPIWIDYMRVVLANIPERQLAMPNGIVSQAGGTWHGDTEYYYSGSVIGKQEASGELDESKQDASGVVSEPIETGAASDAVADKSAKPADINDIIKNIQD